MEKVKIKKPYEGFARKILVEDKLEPGFPRPYEVLDDTGQAYILTHQDSEVKISPFEGKWVAPEFFRIATFPTVHKEDIYYIPGIEEKVIQESKESIMKQEDGKLLTLLSSAISDYTKNEEHVVTPNHTIEIGSNNPIQPQDFFDLVARIQAHGIDVKNIVISPLDLPDLCDWDQNKLSKFNIIESTMVPPGNTFLLADKEYVGVLPILYFDVVENDNRETFNKGWVIDELIGMMILNARSIGVIKKTL